MQAQDLRTVFYNVNIEFNFSFGATIMPKNIVHLSFKNGKFKMAWTKAEGFRQIMYSDNRLEAKVWHPKLLFISNGYQLQVTVVKPGPIKAKTILYEAPYDNMGSGKLCFGSVKRPKEIKDIKKFIREMETAFLYGEFTHQKYLNFWRNKAKSQKRINYDKLKKLGELEQILQYS